MSISYSIHKNHLTNGADNYRGVVHFAGTVDLEGVIERMIADGELPNFRRFREEHAWGGLINPGPSTSPRRAARASARDRAVKYWFSM